MDGCQVGADLLKVVVSSNSNTNTTRDATGGGSRDREEDEALSLFELSLHAEPHTQRLDPEFLSGLLGY